MLKGMKGYQLTPSDLDFIKKMQEEKLIKKLQVILAFFTLSSQCSDNFLCTCQCADAKGCLDCPQGDLEEVQRLLKNEMMATEMTWAVREKAQAELKKVGLVESCLKQLLGNSIFFTSILK